MTDTIRNYIKSLNADEIRFIIEDAGHTIGTWDPTDVTVLRGYLLCMVDQGSIELDENVNPFNGKTRARIEADQEGAVNKANTAKTKGTEKKWREIANNLRKELSRVPAVWAEEQAQSNERAEVYLRSWLESRVEDADEVRQKLAEEFSSSLQNAMYALEWMGGKGKALEMGRLAATVFLVHEARAEKGEPISLREAAEVIIGETKKVLLDDRYRGGSSSAYSNALDAEKRAAASDFIDTLRWRMYY